MATDDLQDVRSTIRRERERLGLSYRQLAERTGMTPSTLVRLEGGQIGFPKPEHLQRIASALGIDVEDLYAEAGYSITTDQLPDMAVYLRAKYKLSPEAVNRVEGYVQSLTEADKPKEGSNDDNRDSAP